MEYTQFFTATIVYWKHLLLDNQHKDIILDSFKFLVADKRIILNACVIMSNHSHLIWQPTFAFTLSDIQGSLLKHTARRLKHSPTNRDATALEEYKVGKYDRAYQFWKRKYLSIEFKTHAVIMQKLSLQPRESGVMYNPRGLLLFIG